MTRPPDFEQIVGADADPREEARLRKVHDMLVHAGPPPELSPEIAAGPTLRMTLQRPAGRVRHRVLLLAAALAVAATAFLAGYISGNGGGDGLAAGHTIQLVGTKAAPGALASLRVEPADPAGNWPMRLSVTGLAKLPPKGYYSVYLIRDGKPYAPCGTFVVAGEAHGATVWLNAPYRLKPHDSWIVLRQLPGQRHDAGTVVLRPTV